MNKKFIAGLVAFALMATYPLSALSSQASKTPESVVLTSGNVVVLRSEVNGESAAEVIAKVRQLDAALSGIKEAGFRQKRPIYLFLNTPGGSIQSGDEIIEAINGLGRPVHTITLFAASMGFALAQSLGDRLILKSGVLMSHHARGEFQGEFGGPQGSQVDNRYQLWLDRIKEFDELTVKRSSGKQTYETYTKQYDHEMWLTGTKAVEQGYADKVVTVKCDSSLNGVTTQHASFMGIDIAYDLDNCPLNTNPMNVRVGGGAGPVTTDALTEIKTKFATQFMAKQKQFGLMAAPGIYW